MAFDFPSSPTTGQTYSITGGPTYVYNGTAWVVLTPGNQFNRTVFTATAGQTTFTMNYVVGAIDVYRNGVKLAPADFTATNGTSIVLANGCTVGDTIEVISYPMITYSDAVKRTGDTMTGDLTIQKTGINARLYLEPLGSSGRKYGVISNLGGSLTFYDAPTDTVRMEIDSAGRVLKPYQPMCFVSHTSIVTYSTIGSLIQWTASYDPNSMFSGAPNYRITVPVAGRYLVSCDLLLNTASTGNLSVAVRKNGSGIKRWYSPSGYGYAPAGGTVIINCAANDYIDVITTETNETIWGGDIGSLTVTLIG